MFEAVIIASLALTGVNTAITADAYVRTIRAMDAATYAAQRPALIQQSKDNAMIIAKAVRTARYCKHPVGDRLYGLSVREVSIQNIPEELKVAFRQTLDGAVAQGPDRKAMATAKFSCEAAKTNFDRGLAKLPN